MMSSSSSLPLDHATEHHDAEENHLLATGCEDSGNGKNCRTQEVEQLDVSSGRTWFVPLLYERFLN
jgi:hypothetical protein